MGGAFSSSSSTKKAPPGGSVTSIDRAVLDLKNARDRLQRYRTQLERDEAKLLARAKAAKASGDQRKALHYLQIRRHKTKEAENVNGQLLTVMEMVDTISAKGNENEVLAALRTGKDALKELHEEMSVDDVIKLMEEVEDQNEVEREIGDILSRGAGLDSVDEELLEKELLELTGEPAGVEEEEKVPKMPEVPSTKLPEVEKKKAEEEKERPAGRIAVAS